MLILIILLVCGAVAEMIVKQCRLRKHLLSARVAQGQLIISIGVETLAEAFHRNDENFVERDETKPLFKVTDPAKFALDVRRALQCEGEDGSTKVTHLLDWACWEAVESGSEAVEEA